MLGGRPLMRLAFAALLASTHPACGCPQPHHCVNYRLQTEVVMGVGFEPRCPRCDRPRTTQVRRCETIPIWVRALRFPHLDVPVEGLTVTLDVVDEFGDPVTEYVEVLRPTVVTDEQGFGELGSLFSSSIAGVYRVRAAFRDRNAVGVTYSGPIIVSTDASYCTEWELLPFGDGRERPIAVGD